MTGAALAAEVVVERPGFTLDVAIDARPGEIVAVMGPSGAGKSTLLAAIAGEARLARGRVAVGGAVVAADGVHVPAARRGVVLLGQDPRLFPHLSARENVAFGLRARGVDRREARSAAEAWLERVGLAGRGGDRPVQLSGGQQQRVAIARALVTQPRVLLLDEPLTSLDPETAAGIRVVLQDQLARAAATALVVTHDVVDAIALGHALAVIEGGALTQLAPVRQVLAEPATDFAATVAGVNRVTGFAPLTGADPAVTAVFSPSVVALEVVRESAQPGASARPGEWTARPGEWTTRIARLEQTLGGVRVHTKDPDVAVDLTVEDATELSPGVVVRLRVDPSRVRIYPSRVRIVGA